MTARVLYCFQASCNTAVPVSVPHAAAPALAKAVCSLVDTRMASKCDSGYNTTQVKSQLDRLEHMQCRNIKTAANACTTVH